MKDYHINVFYSDEDEGYIADIPDLRHCSAFGETPEEALAEVLKAKDAWIKAAKAARKPIPPRRSAWPSIRLRRSGRLRITHSGMRLQRVGR